MQFGIHHNDMDGIATKTIMALYGIPVENLFQAEYPEDGVDPIAKECLENIKNSGQPGEIYMGDISPTDEMCETLDQALKDGTLSKLVIGDHHVTRAYLREKYDWYYYNENKCGAAVLAEALGIKYRDKWLHLISVYDLWLLDDPLRPLAEDLNRLQLFLGSDIIFDRLFMTQETHNLNFKGFEKRINSEMFGDMLVEAKRRQEKFVQEALKRCKVGTDKNGNKVAYLVGDTRYSSEVGREVLKKFTVDYFVGINFFTDGMSFRCLPGFDVGSLCAERRGGGHKEAAGCGLPDGWENMTIKEIVGVK